MTVFVFLNFIFNVYFFLLSSDDHNQSAICKSCVELHIEVLKTKEKLKSVDKLAQAQKLMISKLRNENNQLRKENERLSKQPQTIHVR